MTKTEIRELNLKSHKNASLYNPCVDSNIPAAAIYALLESLNQAILNGEFNSYIHDLLENDVVYRKFPEWLKADDFSESGYNFWFGEFHKYCQASVVSGISFYGIRTSRFWSLWTIFFGGCKIVHLKAHIRMIPLGISTNLSVDFKVYKDGRTETINGYTGLKDIYLNLKEKFLSAKVSKDKLLASEEKSRLDKIGQQILEAAIDPRLTHLIREDCVGEYGNACGTCKKCRRLGIPPSS